MWNRTTLARVAVILGLVGLGAIAMLHEILDIDEESLEATVSEQVQMLTQDTGPAHGIF